MITILCHRKNGTDYTCFINDTATTEDLHIIELGFSRPKPCVIGPRIRRHTLIHFIFQGEGTFNNAPLSAGQGFLVNPNSLHTFTVDSDPWLHCWVAFQGKEDFIRRIGLTSGNQIFSFRPDPTLLQRLTDLTAPEKQEQVNEYTLISLFYQMLSLIEGCRQSPHHQRGHYTDMALSLIHSRYSEPIRIAEIAKQINLSEGYLWRIFRREMGCSPLQYLERVRLDEAKRLLLETNLSATEIASATGFPSATAFFQRFKKITGQTPNQYRKRSTED